MEVNVEIYLDPTTPDTPITQTIDVDPNSVISINSHRGTDFARVPGFPNEKVIVRFFPDPAKAPTPPEPPEPDSPVVESVNPTEVSMAAGATPVQVFGTGFTDPSTVYVSNLFQPTTWVSETELTINYAPDSLGEKTVKVMSNSVMSENSVPLTVIA